MSPSTGGGEELEDNCESEWARPPFYRNGRGFRIAVRDHSVLGTNVMELLIRTTRGEVRSLADGEKSRLLAQGLSALRAYSALMINEIHGVQDIVSAI